MPFVELPRRPMQIYCQYQECTTAGTVSRNVGKQMVRMFQTSVPGQVMEKSQAYIHAMEYAAKRGITTPNLRTTKSASPGLQVAGMVQKDVLNNALSPDLDRSLATLTQKATRLLVWNNLELIDPPDQRRRAQLMARMKARNALACRLSAGLLPTCQMDKEDVVELELPNSNSTDLIIDDLDDTVLVNNGSMPLAEQAYLGSQGFRLKGVSTSCSLQGGCRINHDIPPGLFEGEYLGEIEREELVFKYIPSKSAQHPAVQQLYLIPDVRTKVKERAGWKPEVVDATFAALVLPNYRDLNAVLAAKLPFLYLDAKRLDSYAQRDEEEEENMSAEELEDVLQRRQRWHQDSVSIFDPVNWGRPWVDWRLAQPCFNAQTCLGIFDIKRKLCVVPLVIQLEPFP